jgi:hypothetical protein
MQGQTTRRVLLMNRSFAVGKIFSFRALGMAAFLLAALVLFAGPASACCTAVVCPFAVSSSSNCVGGPNTPVCNVFGCNCNTQCGEYAYVVPNSCSFYPTCDSAAARSSAQARFDEIDTNHDGKVSLAELQAWAPNQKDWAKNVKSGKDLKAGFSKTDKNRDGTVTAAEFDVSLAPAKK